MCDVVWMGDGTPPDGDGRRVIGGREQARLTLHVDYILNLHRPFIKHAVSRKSSTALNGLRLFHAFAVGVDAVQIAELCQCVVSTQLRLARTSMHI